jgi:hypothetical protein
MPLAQIDLAGGRRPTTSGPSEKSSTDSATVRCSNRRRRYEIVRFVQIESR